MNKIAIADANFAHHPKSCADGFESSYFEWDRSGLPVSNTCFITDAFLHKVTKCNAKRKVAWLIEPRSINPGIYNWISENNKLYDYVLTFDKELLDRGENFLYMPFIVSWISPTRDSEIQKSPQSLCSMIASSKNMCDGHEFRQKIIKSVSGRVDHFGRGFKEIEDKFSALGSYQFSIVLENTRDDYYFSEKIIDCFATRTVPIYWGSSGIYKHYNPKGIISFETVEELHEILDTLSPELYQEMYDDVLINWGLYNSDTSSRIPEDWMFKNYPFLFK